LDSGASWAGDEAAEAREVGRIEVGDAGGWISGVTKDGEGRIWVADAVAGRVWAVDSTGAVVHELGPESGLPLRTPCCLAVGPDGRLWVRDAGSGLLVGVPVPAPGAAVEVEEAVALGTPAGGPAVWTPVAFAGDSVVDLRIGPGASGERYLRRTAVPAEALAAVPSGGEVPALPASARSREWGPLEVPEVPMEAREVSGGQATFRYWPTWAPRWVTAPAPDGRWASMRTDTFRVELRGPGDASSVLEGSTPPGPPRATGPGAGMEADPGAETEPALGVSASAGGEARAAPFRTLFYDGDGRLWIEAAVPAGARRAARVYGPAGDAWTGRHWPAGVELGPVGWVGERDAVGVASDPDGGQHLVVLRWE
jgi:hypothetical protein